MNVDQKNHPKLRDFGLLVFACMQNALIGGLLYGWAGIDYVLLQQPIQDGGVGFTYVQTARLFSMGSSVAMASPLVLGPILDAFGPRKALLTSHVLVGSGMIGMALAQPQAFYQWAAAVFLVAVGGPGVQLSVVHMANLFPHHKFVAMSFITGCITLSFSVFSMLAAVMEAMPPATNLHRTYPTVFAGYSVLIWVSMVGTYLLSPDQPLEAVDTHKLHNANDTDDSDGLESPISQEEAPLVLQDDETSKQSQMPRRDANLADQPLMPQLCSAVFVRAVTLFIVISFLVNFTIASLNTELDDITTFEKDEQVSLSKSFGFLLSLGMPFAVLVGYLLDRLGLEMVTFLSLLVGLVSTILMLAATFLLNMGNYGTMIVSFVVYSLFRQFVFVVFLSWISARLGMRFFGILSGIGFASAGFCQFFMSDLLKYVHGDFPGNDAASWEVGFVPSTNYRWMYFHIFQIGLLLVMMVIPLANFYDQRKKLQTTRDQIAGLKSLFQTKKSTMETESSVDSYESITATVPIFKGEKQNGQVYGTINV